MAIKKCPYCKAIIDNSAEFCSNCGTKLLFPEDEMIEEDIPGEKIQEKEEPPKKNARKRKSRRKKPAADKKAEAAAEEVLPEDSAPPLVDEVSEEERLPDDVSAVDVDKPERIPDSFAPENIEPDAGDSEPAEIDTGEPEAEIPDTTAPDDFESLIADPEFDTEEPPLEEPEFPEPEDVEPVLEEPGFEEPPIELDVDGPEGEDGFDPVEIIDDAMGVPDTGPESLTPSEPPIQAEEDAGDLDTDEWDVDEHIREKETGEFPVPPGVEPLPDEDGPDPALFPDEDLTGSEDSQDDPEFKTADLEKMVDPAEKEKEEIERFLDSLKKERQEIKDKYGDDTNDLPAWASNEGERAGQGDVQPNGDPSIPDSLSEADQEPESLSGLDPVTGSEMPLEIEPESELDLDQDVELEPGFIPEADSDLEPLEIPETDPSAPAVPQEDKYEEPGLLFGSSAVSSREPKKKKIRRRKAFLPKDILSLLKVRAFDALFIAALWFITLWIASRLTEVSVFKLIGDSLTAALALYIILLGMYFFFFFFFLGETLGNQLFAQDE